MCGRFTLRTPPRTFTELFDLAAPHELAPRYNIAPSQLVLAIREGTDRGREAAWCHWGLIPSWAKDPSIAYRMINARSESAAEKPAFRGAMRERRCLIPADGFFEWKQEGRQKSPFFATLQDEQPYAYAGLWERWQSPTGPLETCTILTTRANELLAPYHERMPVILDQHDFAEWLDTSRKPGTPSHLFEPYPASAMRIRPVSNTVNSPRHDGPECIAPPPEKPSTKSATTQKSLFD